MAKQPGRLADNLAESFLSVAVSLLFNRLLWPLMPVLVDREHEESTYLIPKV
jgi:hypothetical protein